MITDRSIIERNDLIRSFLKKVGMDDDIILLETNPSVPILVSSDYKTKYCCFVRNFQFNFTEGFGDNIAFSVDLNKLDKIPSEELIQHTVNWIRNYSHIPIFTLRKNNDRNLFVCGFGHKNKLQKTNPYPVFADTDALIYYTKTKAKEIEKNFKRFDIVCV